MIQSKAQLSASIPTFVPTPKLAPLRQGRVTVPRLERISTRRAVAGTGNHDRISNQSKGQAHLTSSSAPAWRDNQMQASWVTKQWYSWYATNKRSRGLMARGPLHLGQTGARHPPQRMRRNRPHYLMLAKTSYPPAQSPISERQI